MQVEPLWRTGDQQERLTELLSADSEQKELPLRRDVRSLGRLLGEILREQEGNALFETVETLRQLARQHRDAIRSTVTDGDPTPNETERMATLQQIISSLSVADAYRVTKAFAIYFE